MERFSQVKGFANRVKEIRTIQYENLMLHAISSIKFNKRKPSKTLVTFLLTVYDEKLDFKLFSDIFFKRKMFTYISL